MTGRRPGRSAPGRRFVAAGGRPRRPGRRAIGCRSSRSAAMTDVAGVLAAVRAGADAIGLNLVPGTPRRSSWTRRSSSPVMPARAGGPGPHPRVVGRHRRCRTRAPRSDRRRASTPMRSSSTVGSARRGRRRSGGRPGRCSICRPRRRDAARSSAAAAVTVEAGAGLPRGRGGAICSDTAGGPFPGGTGRRPAATLAAAVAREVPVVLAGGLDAANVAGALLGDPGRRRRRGVRRRGAARRAATAPAQGPAEGRASSSSGPGPPGSTDPTSPARPTPVHPGLLEADERGRWGDRSASSAVGTCPRP